MIVIAALIAGLVAMLYVRKPHAALASYLLSLAVLPFYWTPFDLRPLSELSVQRLLALGISLGLALNVLRDLHTRTFELRMRGADCIILFLVGIWSVAGFRNVSTTAGVRYLLHSLLDVAVPFALASRCVTTPEELARVFRYMALGALIAAFTAVAEFLAQQPLMWDVFNGIYYTPAAEEFWLPGTRAGVLRVQGAFGQPIFLAFYLVAGSLAALPLAARSRGSIAGLSWTILSIALALVALLPMVRGAAVALIAGPLVYFWLRGHRIRTVGVFVLFTALLGATLTLDFMTETRTFWGEFAGLFSGSTYGVTSQQQLTNWDIRMDVVRTGIDIIAEAPLLGYGDASVDGSWPIFDVVNVFVLTGIVSGPVGLLFLILFGTSIGIASRRLWLRLRASEDRAVIACLVALHLIILLCWLNSSWPGQFTQVCWLLAGATMSLYVRGGYSLRGRTGVYASRRGPVRSDAPAQLGATLSLIRR